MFASFHEEPIFRFREFDEARGFIEDLQDNKDTYEAIDYMINHKEYYFLLKNLKAQLNKSKIGVYIFLNLPCLKREDDLELIEYMLKHSDEVLKEGIVDYLKSCKNFNFARKIFEDGLEDEAIEVLKLIPEGIEYLKEHLKDERLNRILIYDFTKD